MVQVLADGRQLYANASKWRLSAEKEDTHTNTDPKRRVWTVREAPDKPSATEVLGREAAYWLIGVPLCPLCCVLGCLIHGGGDGGSSSSSGSYGSGSSSSDGGSGDGGDGG